MHTLRICRAKYICIYIEPKSCLFPSARLVDKLGLERRRDHLQQLLRPALIRQAQRDEVAAGARLELHAPGGELLDAERTAVLAVDTVEELFDVGDLLWLHRERDRERCGEICGMDGSMSEWAELHTIWMICRWMNVTPVDASSYTEQCGYYLLGNAFIAC